MRLAIIGKTGQLARALLPAAEQAGYAATSYDRADCDLSAPSKQIEKFIDGLDVDAVIIAAAYTAVDTAESDYETALAVNARAPEAIARACARRDIALVHVSTDYVFSGEASTPYAVDAPTQAVNAYGRSKLAGEAALLSAHQRAAVLRTSWVFDGTGKNFMTTMLRLGQSRSTLSVVSDQIGRPTYAGHLAQACLAAARALHQAQSPKAIKAASGLYHVSGSGEPISWADFAAAIFERAQGSPSDPDRLPHSVSVTPIPTADYPTPAKRPAYSVLDISRFESELHPLPHWREGLEQAYTEWAKSQNEETSPRP